MKTIAVVNRRGGAGKTVTAHAIGAGLAQRGYKILFIDLDSQCNLTFDKGVKNGTPNSMDILTGEVSPEEAVQHFEDGDIIPASPNLAVADTAIEGTGKEHRLEEALESIAGSYDYCIIDTPPALGVLTVNALTVADEVIIPAQAEIHSIQGITLLEDAIQAVKKYTNPNIHILGILITRYNGRAILSKDMKRNLEELAKTLDTKVFNTPIRECVAVKEAQAVQQDIYSYAPRSNASKDYTALIEDILRA